MGTAIEARQFPANANSWAYSGSASMSGTWAILPSNDRPPGSHRAVGALGIRLENVIEDLGREIVACRIVKEFAIVSPDHAEHCFAQTRGTFDNRIEHRLGIRRRPSDDAEDFAGSRLLLQRLVPLALLRGRVVPGGRQWTRVRPARCEPWAYSRSDPSPAVRFHRVAACRPLLAGHDGARSYANPSFRATARREVKHAE